MTSNNSNSSDVGFIVLISFALLALIPLAIGFESFSELFHIGKIMLIVVLVVAVTAGGVFAYLFFRGKIRRRTTKNDSRTDRRLNAKNQGNITKIHEKVNPTENED